MQDGKSKPTETTPLMPHNYTLRNDGVIPQLFTSVPTLNDAASYLSQTTSSFTRCFTDDSGNHASSITTYSSLSFFKFSQPIVGVEKVEVGSWL
ncbi:hypothetical protein ACFX14_027739 [Malus domestica]